jgi:Ca2+-binding RTX toxin-like protein
VSELFDEDPGSLLLFDVEAHSVTGGVITEENLVQGGQLSLLEAPELDDDDVLVGTRGNDTQRGGLGNDDLRGGAGNDTQFGGRDNDRLQGGLENDTQDGGFGNDLLTGGVGNDSQSGGQGDDILIGLVGRDVLRGDQGNDLLTGGRGNDTFILAANEGTDTITDFDLADDVLGLAGGLIFEQLTITQGVGAQIRDTLIRDTNTDELLAVLRGVRADTINSNAFESVLA